MTSHSPDTELRAAAALVFVEDLGAPELSPDDGRHLGEVLRLKPGEAVAAADGAGSWRMCAFTTAAHVRRALSPTGGGRYGLEVAGPLRLAEAPSPPLEIGFSWAKADRTEWAVAKLVELGVDVLTPLVADRTVVRPDTGSASRRAERLRRIVKEAAMQSRRPFLPRLGASESLDDLVATRPSPSTALAEPGGDQISLCTPVVLIGPEGGWSSRELALVDKKVTLGDGILRVETAALAAGALLSALRAKAVSPDS